MKERGFKHFYGDGQLVGYCTGPGDSVILIVDHSDGPAGEFRSVWLGRVRNFEKVCRFLKSLGPPDVGRWNWPINELALDPATARQPVKHVYVDLPGETGRKIIIECGDVAES